MKKSIFIILALALVFSFVFVAAPDAHAEETTAHTHCYCINADAKPEDHVCSDNQEWTAITASKTISADGYYFLNWTGNKAASITVSKNINAYLCLNGARIFAGTTIKLNSGATLTICDCSDNGSGSITVSGGAAASPLTVGGSQTVNLYSGNITGTGNGKSFASVTMSSSTAVFNMYGGSITGGSSDKGGNVSITRGIFTMYGGTISGGKATSFGGNIAVHTAASGTSTFVMNGGTISGGSVGQEEILDVDNNVTQEAVAGQGGNVSVSCSVGSFVMNNGTISNGVATANGGNLFFSSGSATITGGSFVGGSANLGGSIYANKALTLTGVSVSGGEATEKGGNIYVTNGSTVTLDGATVSGGVAGKVVSEETNADTGDVTTTTTYTGNGGNIYIDDGGKETTNAVHVTNSTVTGGKAQYGGNIYTTDELYIEAGAIISDGFAVKAGGNIRVDGTGSKLDMSAGTISGGNAGETGGNINSLNCTNVSITGGTIENGTAGQGGNLYIVHSSFVATRKLTISDATITGGNATAGNGGNLYISRVGQVTLTDVTMTDGVATESGSNIYAQLSHIVNISGGTYSVAAGNRKYTTTDTDENYINLVQEHGVNSAGTRISGNGGNICIAGISGITTTTTSTDENGQEVTTETTTPGSGTITGATILGGNAVNGGALYIGSGAVTLDGITAKSCGGESGRVLHVAKNATVTLKDSTMVNWGTKGTALTNKGTLILVGTINLNKEYSAAELKAQANGTDPNVTLDIVVDCVDNADAVLDITGLTAVDEAITVNRLGTEDADGTKHTEAGLVAIGANETNAAMLVCSHAAYKLVQDGTNINLVAKAVWGMNGTDAVIGYESLAEIAEDDGATWYVLNTALENQTINKSIMLDLGGYDLSAEIADGVVVSLIDSANDKYDASACGKLTKTGTGTVETIVHTTGTAGGSTKHYVILKNEDGTYSAHRYVAAVVKMSLKPGADALGYKASFSADSVARAAMKNYGISVWVNENYKISNAKDGAISANSTPLTLRVQNVLAAGGGETTVYGDAFITFVVDGQEVVANTSVKNTSMKTFIETMEKEMEAGTATYTAEQITAVQELLNKYESKVFGWNIDSILAWTAPADEEETPAA